MIEPMDFDIDRWLGALRRYTHLPLLEYGRQQPPMPEDDVHFESNDSTETTLSRS